MLAKTEQADFRRDCKIFKACTDLTERINNSIIYFFYARRSLSLDSRELKARKQLR